MISARIFQKKIKPQLKREEKPIIKTYQPIVSLSTWGTPLTHIIYK